MIEGLGDLVALIEKVSGNVIPERDLERFETIAKQCVIAARVTDLEEYIALLKRDQDGAEWRRLLSLITANESYLFRSSQQFEALRTKVIPDLVNRRMPPRFNVWSAGGARGEEACTLAMVLAESRDLVGWNWQVVATDVDEVALADAKRGIYGARAVSKVPPDLLEKYFHRRGDDFEFSPSLRRRIEYRAINLVQPPYDLGFDFFDIVFFRNVLIYFRPESQKRVANAVATMMADDGYLFLGASESLWQLYPDLEPVDLGNCFTYRWARRNEVPDQDASDAWKKLEESTGKFHVIPKLKPEPEPAKTGGNGDLSRAAMRTAIVDAVKDGLFEEGKEMIREAKRHFPDDAVVRALEGLIFDLIGDVVAAVRSYRAALYLDPGLFQVRFLLAKGLERLGRKDRARREFQAVLAMVNSVDGHDLPPAVDVPLPQRQQIQTQCLAKTR